MIRKFTFLVESTEIINNIEEDLKTMIQNSLKNSDYKSVDDFMVAYKEDAESNPIEGLINSSDIYDFYLKYQPEVDEVLNKADFYSKSPRELNTFGLYDYVIIATKEAVSLIVNDFGKKEEQETDF